MTRIEPLSVYGPEMEDAAAAHVATGARMTNMKNTLAHDRVAFDALMTWYPLHDSVKAFLGERRAQLYCHAISTQADCLICSTFFRRLLIDQGEDPDNVELDEEDRLVVELGRQLAIDAHGVSDDLFGRLRQRYDEPQVVLLIAFGALMLATNVVNDALQVPLDDYLHPYRPASASPAR
jgi:alkylhydroperoxidase family enzyme